MQLPFKVNAHVMVHHSRVQFCWVHLGTRLRLQVSSWRNQLSGIVSALRQLSANTGWDCIIQGKGTATLVTLPTFAWPFSYNNWWLHDAVPTHYAVVHCADAHT